MWILLSVLAAVTSGISVILQKKGTSGKNVFQISAVSNTATLAVMVIVALILGSFQSIGGLTSRCWQITALSGLVLAASWITYFVALRDAEVNIMMALDKANIIAAMLLAHFMLGERITWIMICGTVLILLGTALMTETGGKGFRLWDRKNMWMFWGVVSPILQWHLVSFDVPRLLSGKRGVGHADRKSQLPRINCSSLHIFKGAAFQTRLDRLCHSVSRNSSLRPVTILTQTAQAAQESNFRLPARQSKRTPRRNFCSKAYLNPGSLDAQYTSCFLIPISIHGFSRLLV
jgi:transporter family protein